MIIHINCSNKQFRRDLQLLKMLQFEKVDYSCYPKTVRSRLRSLIRFVLRRELFIFSN